MIKKESLNNTKKIKTKRFTPKKITTLALALSILVITQIISYFLPSLPSGLGSWFTLFEFIVIIYSFTLGITNTIILGLIFYGVLAWTAPSIFMSGITYVKSWELIFAIYGLDYLIPFTLFAFSSWLYRIKPSNLLMFLNTFLMIFLAYLSNVFSGRLFWGAYAWNGWSVWAYAFVANLTRTSILLVVTSVLIKPCVTRLQPWMSQELSKHQIHY